MEKTGAGDEIRTHDPNLGNEPGLACPLFSGISFRFLALMGPLNAPHDGELRIWDTHVRGFMLRIASSGRG
ncbi:MAG TPA: hypothetical protein PKY87_06800 [Terricaulis sp.]|nr:hypothetical protein [Terricaulis sp.]